MSRRPKSPPGGRAEPSRASGRSRPNPAPPGRIWLYGQHAVAAALANPDRPCYRVLVDRGDPPGDRGRRQVASDHAGKACQRSASPSSCHRRRRIRGWPPPSAPCPTATPGSSASIPAQRSLVLALDQVNDPRNLGAILRTAAALGVEGVILPDRRSAELGGACAKAASGALDLVPLVEVVNLGRTLADLKQRGYWVVGLDAAGSAALETLDLPPRIVLVLGSEGEGLRRLVAEQCDHLARLEIDPRMESLNVSVAAGIALYLLARRCSRRPA